MKIYAVMGGWNHENESADSLQLFTTLKAANEYGEDIVKFQQFDYFVVEEIDFAVE